MRKFLSDFFLRGLAAAAGGPVVMAIIYGILGATGAADALIPVQVCREILTITLLALIAGGMTAIYQVERLPLFSAIAIHGSILYLSYILVYLVNGWLMQQIQAILVFTAIFLLGYALIWLCIYLITRAKTERLNRKLREEHTQA